VAAAPVATSAPVLPYRPRPAPRAAIPHAGTVVPSVRALRARTFRTIDEIAVDGSIALVAPENAPMAPMPSAALPPAVAPAPLSQPAAPKPTARSRPHVAPTQASDKGGDEHGPLGPLGPPSRSFFGAAGSAPAGTAAACVWCALLLGLAAYGVRELRRHRLQFVALEQGGFVSPQQRPG
jgi:hypothetical protein